MHRFRRILFVAGPGPGSASVGLERAVALSRANGGRLVVAAVGGGAERLERLVVAAADLGMEAEPRALGGDPPEAVIREVVAGGHDLVMKEAEDVADGVRGRLFGGTDRHLLRNCPCPIWLFPSGGGGRIRSVLAAVDVEGRVSGGLNERVLQVASSLAVGEGAALHVVHAWSLYGESILKSRGRGLEPGRLRSLLRETRRARAERLRSLVSRAAVAGSDPALHLVKARPALAIRHVARRVEADVVVMGTVSRSGATGLLIGNTAEIVLGRLPCAALTVKPAGFRTPRIADPHPGLRSAPAG